MSNRKEVVSRLAERLKWQCWAVSSTSGCDGTEDSGRSQQNERKRVSGWVGGWVDEWVALGEFL